MILFGLRAKRRRLGTVFTECPQCHRACSQVIARSQRWFTLFFIPVIPFAATYLTVCSMCSGATKVDRDRAEHLSALGAQPAGQPPAAPAPGSSAADTMPPGYPPMHGGAVADDA